MVGWVSEFTHKVWTVLDLIREKFASVLKDPEKMRRLFYQLSMEDVSSMVYYHKGGKGCVSKDEMIPYPEVLDYIDTAFVQLLKKMFARGVLSRRRSFRNYFLGIKNCWEDEGPIAWDRVVACIDGALS